MPKLIVVIVSWNTKELTHQCLKTLYNDISEINNEVWVVDNNSKDDSVAMIKNEFPEVRLIENKDNVGFARANNQALRKADGDFYLLLNSDTIIPEGSLSGMYKYMVENPDSAAVGPKLSNNNVIQHSFTPLPSLSGEIKYCLAYHFFPFGSIFRWLFFQQDEEIELLKRPLRVELLSAACLMIRKNVIEQVGLLSEDYFLFSEENDYFFRMKQAGLNSYYLPQIEITHLIGKSREKRLKIDSEINFLKSRLIFFQKFFPGSVGFIKTVYHFFFGWSYMVTLYSKYIKGDSQYNLLYSRLIKTLREIKYEK